MTYRWKATEFPVLTRRQVDKYHNPARQDLDNYFMTTRHVLTYRHPGNKACIRHNSLMYLMPFDSMVAPAISYLLLAKFS